MIDICVSREHFTNRPISQLIGWCMWTPHKKIFWLLLEQSSCVIVINSECITDEKAGCSSILRCTWRTL